ncbi:MAG: hypothetical protein IKA20_02045 [Clostridia bacterium]|nr:hypothetical protein [Clostridia bacterium]
MCIKKRSLLSLLMVLVLTLLVLISCGKNNEALHVHTYAEWSIKNEASCMVEGLKSRTCSSCGFTEYSSIPKSEHEFDSGVIISYATPVKQGAINYTCRTPGCNYNYIKNYALKLDNAYDILLDGLYANATSIENGFVAFDYYMDWQVQYALSYDEQKRDLVVCTRVRIENEGVVFFNITLEKNTKKFAYLGLFEDIEDSTNSSQTFGYIDGAIFTATSKLSYTNHYGTMVSFNSRMEILSLCASKCVAFLNAFLNINEIGTTLDALGFTAY